MEQTAVSLVLGVFIRLKTNCLGLKMELRTCSFSSRQVVLYRQIRTQIKGQYKSSFAAAFLGLPIWWASKRSSLAQGIVSVHSRHSWHRLQHAGSREICHPSILQAPREPEPTSPSRRRVTVRQPNAGGLTGAAQMGPCSVTQASRKKARDYLLYWTNQA